MTFCEQLQLGFKFTLACHKLLIEILNAANSLNVWLFNYDCGEFEVWNGGSRKKHIMKLNDWMCMCGKFQEICIPCSHVIIACQSMSINYEQYISNYCTLD